MFCSSFAILSDACLNDKAINFAVVDFVEQQCLESFSTLMTTITEIEFDISLVYASVSEFDFNNDKSAQTASIAVLALTMPNVEAESIIISNTSDSRRRLVQAASVTVVYRVTSTLELLGFRSLETTVAYKHLVAKVTNGIDNGFIVSRLREYGKPIFNTFLFESTDFTISSFKFTEPRTAFIETAIPTFNPTESPTTFTDLIIEHETFLSLFIAGFVFIIFGALLLIWFARHLRKKNAENKYGINKYGITENSPAVNDITDGSISEDYTTRKPADSGLLTPDVNGQQQIAVLERGFDGALVPFDREASSKPYTLADQKSTITTSSIIAPEASYVEQEFEAANSKRSGDSCLEDDSVFSLQGKRVILPPISSNLQGKRGPGFQAEERLFRPILSNLRNRRSSPSSGRVGATTDEIAGPMEDDNFVCDPPIFEKRMVHGNASKNSRSDRNSRRYSRARFSAKIKPSNSPERSELRAELDQRSNMFYAGSKRRKHGPRRIPGPGEAGSHEAVENDNIPTITLSPILKKKGFGPGFIPSFIK